MNYLDFEAGNQTYKLRLNTRNIVALEKRIGVNPLAIFGNGDKVPTLTVMVEIFHASLNQLNHGITLDKAYDIFDSWLADGHTMIDFIPVILDIYKASGLVSTESNEKN